MLSVESPHGNKEYIVEVGFGPLAETSHTGPDPEAKKLCGEEPKTSTFNLV